MAGGRWDFRIPAWILVVEDFGETEGLGVQSGGCSLELELWTEGAGVCGGGRLGASVEGALAVVIWAVKEGAFPARGSVCSMVARARSTDIVR